MSAKSTIIAYATIGVVIMVIIGALFAWAPVNTGNVKVVTTFGEVEDVYGPGAHWINPATQNTHSISTRPQLYVMSGTPGEGKKKGADAVRTLTKGQQVAFIDVGVRWRVDPAKADTFFTEYKTLKNVETRLIRDIVRSQIRTEAGGIPVEEISTQSGQTKLQTSTEAALREEMEGTGLILESLQIRNVKFTPEYEKAVEQKEIKKQEIQKSQHQIAVAENEKKAQIVRAEADAQGQLIAARAEAKANREVSRSLTDDLVNYRFVEKLGETDNVYFMSGEGNGENRPVLIKNVDENSDETAQNETSAGSRSASYDALPDGVKVPNAEVVG